MVGQIVVKESAKDFTFVVGEHFKTIMQADAVAVSTVKALIEEYNNSRDKERRAAIEEEILTITAPGRKIENKSDGRFEMDLVGNMYLKGTKTPISEFLAQKLLEYIDAGISVEGLVKFWQRLLLNPDPAVQSQLYSFLEHNGHPITPGGYFLAYKSVNVKKRYDKDTGEEIRDVQYDEDTGEEIEKTLTQDMVFAPIHKGPHGMKIKVGEPVTMPREECDSDPNVTCSAGLHVGNMDYVGTFGGSCSVVLEVLISPTDVVAVPTDYNNTKMRTCKYFPIAISNGENENIFLESDYDEHQKGYLEEEVSKRKEASQEAIAIIEEAIQERGDILDSLY
jgi:hypothetical protein